MVYIIVFALIIGLILQPKVTLSLVGITMCLLIGLFALFIGSEGRDEACLKLFPKSPSSRIERIENTNNKEVLLRIAWVEGDRYRNWAEKYNGRDKLNAKWGRLPKYIYRGAYPYLTTKYDFPHHGTLIEQQKYVIDIILRTEKIKKWCKKEKLYKKPNKKTVKDEVEVFYKKENNNCPKGKINTAEEFLEKYKIKREDKDFSYLWK